MRNITLSADERLIEKARLKARERHTSLNAEFRKWLEQYSRNKQENEKKAEIFNRIIEELSEQISVDRKYTRDEMNERR